MKDYEMTVLFHPDLEMNLDPALDKVKKLIEANNGKITKEETDGKKHTAYPIKKLDFAIYYYFDVQLPAEAPAKISSALNISDEVIRYMLVKIDEKRAKILATKKSDEVNTEKGDD